MMRLMVGGYLALMMAGQEARADEVCVSCERAALERAIQEEDVRPALTHLKSLNEAHPNNRAVTLLLAWAYGAQGNDMWAQRVLHRWRADHPQDCLVISWLAWFHVRNAELSAALDLLDTSGCPDSPEMQTRFSLLSQVADTMETDPNDVASPEPAKRALPEDREMWDQRWRAAAPGRITPVDIRMNFQSGYTTNGSAGTPTDAVSASREGGAFGKMDVESRLVLPTGRTVRPLLEGAARLQGFAPQSLREFSSADLSMRSGIIVGRSRRLTAAYRGTLLLLAMENRTRYLEAHRAELEWETDSGMVAFAGAGRRIFREMGRTRWEVDGGVGYSMRFSRRVFLLGVLTGRYYNAVGDVYDQWGIGPLLSARISLPASMRFRTGVSVALDRYPHSGGSLGEVAFGTREMRRDLTVRHFDELWLPPVGNVDWGLGYDFNYRDSSANMERGTLQYAYSEHRVRVFARVNFQLNPAAPRIVQPEDHVPLRYGLGDDQDDGDSLGREVAEMLRQEEAARAASSCVER